MLQRAGPGRIRHLQIRFLWVQERVRAVDFAVAAVPGASNAADLGTKILQGARVVALCAALGLRPRTVAVSGVKDAKALLSFAVLMASLAPRVEVTSAVVPRDGEAALIVADAAVELSARGNLLS